MVYDTLAEYQKIVPDALNTGRMGMNRKPGAEIQKAIQQFAMQYRKVTYTNFLTGGRLNTYLAGIGRQAQEHL